MSLNESIVENAALTWLPLRPSFADASAGKQDYGGQVEELGVGIEKCEIGRVKVRNLNPFLSSLFTPHSFFREAIRRPAGAGPAIHQSRTLATLRDPAVAELPKLLSGELSVAALESRMEALA